MKPPRLTIRRLMAFVAIAAVSVGLAGRVAHLRALAALHDKPAPWFTRYYSGHEGDEGRYLDRTGGEVTEREVARFHWHARLRKKYLDASRRPWLPVPPDPPRPE